MSDDQQRRAAAVYKDIENVDPQRDIRVRLVGTVIEKETESVKLDDGSGTVEVFMEEEKLEKAEDGGRIRVLGRVMPIPDGFELRAEAVHDLSDVDYDRFTKVKKIVNT